ncbi:MAG: bifunctional 5,10-methylenetetrahydrofolate dehydrogenase/5,10-methenyltetrahydrofolate cyclohydrolase [Candidatus Saccharimonas sp.]
MARLLNGLELQGFIQERQARQVRNLRQEHGIIPKLCIIVSDQASPVIHTYIRMKQRYADDTEISMEVRSVPFAEIPAAIRAANEDEAIQGVILQLPIDDPTKTDEYCNLISPAKDIDGLGTGAFYPSATAQAVDWLLAGYNVSLEGKHITIVGNGKLVGGPLSRLWKSQGFAVTVLDEHSADVDEVLRMSDIIVSAAGVPRLVKSEQIKTGAVVVDAGTTSENGVIVGDVEESVRDRSDVTITPIKGGVGPLTYTVLFDHLIEACLRLVGKL